LKMPMQFSQNFHQLLWGSQTDGSSQEAQTQNELYKSQNETSWQNDSQLSQSLLGNSNCGTKSEIPLNHTIETACLNSNKREQTGTLSQMPLASSNSSAFFSRFKTDDRTSSTKYTIPNWGRGVRGANNAGNTNYSLPQTYGQANSSLQNSIQTKRMEAQQRDVKEYLMSLINSIEQLKKAFVLGQVESSGHMEQFFTNLLNAKFEENNKILSDNIDHKFNNHNESIKKYIALEYCESMKNLSDKTDLLKKYSVDESEKTQQLQQAVNETMNLLGQMQSQVSCFYEVLETLREDKIQKTMGHNDLAIKSNAQFNALRLEINKMKSEVETLLDGQMVIREDLADNKEKSSSSFRDICKFLSKIVGNNENEKMKVSMIRCREELHRSACRNQAAEISTRLDSQFNNSNVSIVESKKVPVCLSVSNSKHLNGSYRLWDVASKNADTRHLNSSFKPQGGSSSILPMIHTSTPKLVGVVKPTVSISASRQKADETKKSELFTKPYNLPITANRNDGKSKRALLKKQRFIPDRPYLTRTDFENQNVIQHKAGNYENMRYKLRSTGKSFHEHSTNVKNNHQHGMKEIEHKSDDSDDMFS